MNFINPEKVLEVLQLSEGMKVTDFGCGAGFFTILMAEAVGGSGEVFAIDVQKSSLESVRIRAEAKGIDNIKFVWADLEILGATKIVDNSLDLVLLADTLFQSSRKVEILTESNRVLSSDGKMVIIDWQPEALGIGPQGGYRVAKEDLVGLGREARFKLEREFDAGDYHYGLIFTKA